MTRRTRWRVDCWGWSPIKGNGAGPRLSASRSKTIRPTGTPFANTSTAAPRTADKADAQLKLAAWCEQKGLKAQALTHYEQVIQLDPTRDTAWKHLGFKKQGNRWVKPDQAAAAKARSRTAKASR